MYSFMAASAHAGMKKLTENKTFLMIYDDIPLLVAVNVQQIQPNFSDLGENIMRTTKDTGDNDDHFYVVPSEKIKFIRISTFVLVTYILTTRGKSLFFPSDSHT